ncbi:protein TUNAR isoform X1 [Scyliorhinus torazame]|uniref:protein TUNAR isoform X1 n=1 Tax=Scyliorhinus torazame TaxID=75743 RepID=UPI003B5CEEAE
MKCGQTAVGLLLKIFTTIMGISAITEAEEVRIQGEKEDREESVLALLGIVGTILNLLVIIFVYIYTTF